MRYYHPFPEAIPHSEAGSSRVTHPSATSFVPEGTPLVRLACVRRAASVRPEPGSNSLIMLYINHISVANKSKSVFFQASSLTDLLLLLEFTQMNTRV